MSQNRMYGDAKVEWAQGVTFTGMEHGGGMPALVNEGKWLAIKEVGKGHDGGVLMRRLMEKGLAGYGVECIPQVTLE